MISSEISEVFLPIEVRSTLDPVSRSPAAQTLQKDKVDYDNKHKENSDKWTELECTIDSSG